MDLHLSETRTEDLISDLLDIQGWPNGRPPKGRVVRQNEYKAFPEFADVFKGKSKSGKQGDAYPDFLIISDITKQPQMIIEAKADIKDLDIAVNEACEVYGSACITSGFPVIAVGVAGQEKTSISIGVYKWLNGKWKQVCYEGNPISWIPTPEDVNSLLLTNQIDLAPVIPKPEILANRADLINRILREANVKDEFRPAYVGAMMLALWQSRGRVRKDPDNVLRDINAACADAFSKGGKTELAHSLHVDEANTKLASSCWRILATLEKLNVVSASFAHDYLGQLYETFFRYTGGNTIGQYFTPRHVTRFMADICETTKDDIIIDPACGTGGFLIACMQRALTLTKLKYEDVITMVKDKLIGYDSEPVTAALCVANMILRGDGRTGIRKDDCFTAKDYPINKCQVSLMNPPFPHKNTDIPPQQFVERALEALEKRGKLAVILPTSLLVKKDTGKWRKDTLKNNTLLAVCQFPEELFQPYASSTTSVVLLEKGVPHNPKLKTVFVRIQYDGLTLKKGTRVLRTDGKNQMDDAIETILNKREIPGFSGLAYISNEMEWSPGAYIPSSIPTDEELKESIDELIRRSSSFYIRYAAEVANQRKKIESGEITVSPYRNIMGKQRLDNANTLPQLKGTIGELFDIFYGQKELHSREGIPPGDSLVVSPTEDYNGCYGWLDFNSLIEAPFVTVAQTGTIGEAFVQREPCGVNDDCLILLPKIHKNLSVAQFFIAASVIRLERWRFSYGRKLTPSRICDFKMPHSKELEKWVDEKIASWQRITEEAVSNYY